MEPFGVPSAQLQSLHYDDAITWVYVHMFVLGAVIGTIGWFAKEVRVQLAFSILMLAVHCLYLYMDLRDFGFMVWQRTIPRPRVNGPCNDRVRRAGHFCVHQLDDFSANS